MEQMRYCKSCERMLPILRFVRPSSDGELRCWLTCNGCNARKAVCREHARTVRRRIRDGQPDSLQRIIELETAADERAGYFGRRGYLPDHPGRRCTSCKNYLTRDVCSASVFSATSTGIRFAETCTAYCEKKCR